MSLEKDELQWDVTRRNLYLGNGAQVEGYKAIVREDSENVLGVFSARYEPVKNAEVRDFAEIIRQESGGTYSGSWSIRNGAVVGIQLEGGTFLVPGDPSEYKDRMVVGNSHDGSLPFVAHPTQIRIVCQNTFYAALYRTGQSWHGIDANVSALGVRLRHTSSVHEKIKLAQDAIRLSYLERSTFAEWADSMQQEEADWTRFVSTLIPDQESERESAAIAVKDARATLERIYQSRTQEGIRQNAYGMFNAGVEYLDHFEEARRKTKTQEANKMLRTVGFNSQKTERLSKALRASLA